MDVFMVLVMKETNHITCYTIYSSTI